MLPHVMRLLAALALVAGLACSGANGTARGPEGPDAGLGTAASAQPEAEPADEEMCLEPEPDEPEAPPCE